MDVLTIVILAVGFITGMKGFFIASLSMSGLFGLACVWCYTMDASEADRLEKTDSLSPEKLKKWKGTITSHILSMLIYFVVLGVSIVKIVM